MTPSSPHVLIVGVSTRAASESAARAGFAVTAIDAFGDLDQHESVRCLSLPRDIGKPFSAAEAARASRRVECDAVVYLSGFENHPKAVATLAAGRSLWGNSPAVLRDVRDPLLVSRVFRRRGFASPRVRTVFDSRQAASVKVSGAWLVKPLKSGGGHGIRVWRHGTGLRRGCYLQEHVEGTPGSVVFVASRGRATPLGVSRQLIGEAAFGAEGYRYCGSILSGAGDTRDSELVDRASALTAVAAEEFQVVGINGIDFIARQGIPHVVEINPRWSASVELAERAYGFSAFSAHAAACADSALLKFDFVEARRSVGAIGKAIVFSRRDVTVGDTREWLADSSVRDVPRPGERIPAGRPVCTVFAGGRDYTACHTALEKRVAAVYAALEQFTIHNRQFTKRGSAIMPRRSLC